VDWIAEVRAILHPPTSMTQAPCCHAMAMHFSRLPPIKVRQTLLHQWFPWHGSGWATRYNSGTYTHSRPTHILHSRPTRTQKLTIYRPVTPLKFRHRILVRQSSNAFEVVKDTAVYTPTPTLTQTLP
jgi:hypothetical protein